MDCNKSKMKKKKYMKENETFTSLKNFYKEILLEGTRAKAERAVLSDYNPKYVPGNKRNVSDFPKLTAAGNPRRKNNNVMKQGEEIEGPRFVNKKDTPKPGKDNRTKKSVSIAGRVLRNQQKIARLIRNMTPSGLKRASQVLQDRGIEIPPDIDPKKLPPNMRSFDFAYNVDNSDQAFRNTNKIRF
jgi:hypothetical protein